MYKKEELEKAVKESLSYAGVLREFGKKPVGGNYKTLKKYIALYDISTEHFTGQAWNTGTRFKRIGKRYSMDEILVSDSPYRSTHKLRLRLIEEGLKQETCEICENSEWNGQKIPLELHHVNGVNTDHRLDNLQILCPNCHAQADSYRGKNKKKPASALSEKREVEYLKFRETLTGNADGNPEPSLYRKTGEGAETRRGRPKSKKLSNCLNCGKEIKVPTRKYCSTSCYRAHEKVEKQIPKVPEILEAFKKLKSFCAVGKHFGVSDNTVRKWCKSYGILDMVKV